MNMSKDGCDGGVSIDNMELKAMELKIKQIKDFIRTEIEGLVDTAPSLPVYYGKDINVLKEWKERVRE